MYLHQLLGRRRRPTWTPDDPPPPPAVAPDPPTQPYLQQQSTESKQSLKTGHLIECYLNCAEIKCLIQLFYDEINQFRRLFLFGLAFIFVMRSTGFNKTPGRFPALGVFKLGTKTLPRRQTRQLKMSYFGGNIKK